VAAHLVIHGHFYQPPRENPWTETVPVEPSAAPYRNWNERITAECYLPNAHARIVDDHGLVLAIVNDYELLSFNLGPTLASWLQGQQPHVYRHIIEADRRAGTAIAQAFNHSILPLCAPRDARTQIRWGLADFRYRFGRDADGLWLPETAVNDAVLAMLVEEGVQFTILAPGQAASPIEPGKAYRWEHPDGSGRSIAVVFYDGALSHDVAFGITGQSASALVARAREGSRGGLVTIATDGETFGHHHKFAERTVAYALAVEAGRQGMTTGPLIDWLRENPPTETVQVHESAWSCAHGVGRWKEDCGCSNGGQPGWNQQWRAPLRRALEVLRAHCHQVFETQGAALFVDPWEARDAYVLPLLDRAALPAFLEAHLRPGADRVAALTMLEAERHAMLMFTSCGWFFADLAGIETQQVLRYAARCIELLEQVGDNPPTEAFLDVLATAHSNVHDQGNGRDVWERHVVPSAVGPGRVVAHIALLELLDRRGPDPVVGGFEVHVDRHRYIDRGPLAQTTGRVTLVHRRTGREHRLVYAAIHLGGIEVLGMQRPEIEADKDDEALDDLEASFAAGASLTRQLRRMAEEVGGEEFDVKSGLPDAPGRLLETAVSALTERFGAEFERLLADHRPMFTALAAAGHPLPPELRVPAQLALARRLEADLVSLGLHFDRVTLRAAESILEEAEETGILLDTPRVVAAAEEAVDRLVRRAADTGEPAAAEAALQVFALVRKHGLTSGSIRAQEWAYVAIVANPHSGPLMMLGRALGLAVGRLGVPD
jgi:hypothetical protein